MAKKIVDEQIKLSIIIDGNQAQSELYKVEKSTRELTAVNKTLLAEKNKLERQGKKETEEYKKLNSTIRQNNQVIKENKARISELQNQIGVTGMTIGQLNQKASQLKLTLRHMVPGSADYIRYENDLNKITNRLQELRGKAQATKVTIGSVADSFNRYAALGATVLATTTGVVISLQKMIDYNGKLSDAQADVMKTTSMTKKEVDELTKSFGLLQTRTSRINLLKIAEEGGRIGIANKDIKEFVRVMDIANVALGDSFVGGVEEVASKLGKLKMLFSETKDLGVEDAYMRIGSAINDLGANGVATERNITEFTTRIGSLPDQLKPSIAETLALGAAFEESGIEAEVSARAYSIFLNRASTETESFAKVMNLPVQKVKEMINASPLEFFLSFAERLKNINPEATEMAQILDMLKINADGANKVIGAAANNTQRFRDTIELSNESMKEGTSLINEFGVKNNNLAATLDKIKKKVVGWYSSETLIEWLTDAVNWFALFIGATEDSDGKMAKFKNGLVITAKVFSVLLAAMITNVAWQKLVALWTTRNTQATLLYNLATKGRAVAENLAKIATLSYIAITSLLTGNIKTATIAARGLTVALASTPFGALLAIVAAVTTAYIMFSEKTDNATKAQQTLNEVNNQANSTIAAQKTEVELLLKIAKDETREKGERLKAIKKLNEISPEYLGKLNLENIKTNEATIATKKYTQALYENARAKAAKTKFDELEAEKLNVENTTGKDYRGRGQKVSDSFWKMFGVDTQYFKDKKEIEKYVKNNFSKQINLKNSGAYDEKTFNELVDNIYFGSGLDKKEAKLASISAQQKILEEQILKNEKSVDDLIKTPKDPNPIPPLPIGDNKKNGKSSAETEAKKQEREHEARIKEIEKYYDTVLKLARDYEDGNYQLMEDGYEKEKQVLETQHQRNIQDLKARLVSTEEIEKAQNASKNEKLTEEQRKSYEVLAKAWLKNNEGIYKKVEQETDIHCLKLATTVEKYAKNEVDILNKQYEEEKVAREIAYNERLVLVGNDQKKRAEEEKKFKEEEYQKELEHLQSLTDLYTKLINNDLGNGIDFDLLTPEAKEKLKADIELLNLAIAKLKAAKSGETDDKPKEASLNMSETDILGFSQDQWTTFFKNIENGTFGIESLKFAVQALQNLWAQYGAMVEAGENRRLQQYEANSNKKQQRLQRQLNSGIISQDQYNKAVEAIDNDLARKKAELEYKQAKRKRKMDLASAFSSMALGLIQAWVNPGFPMAIPLSALIAGMGAMQIATIAKQPLPAPGFESGYYSNHLVKREQDGKIFNSTFGGKTKSGVVHRPTHFLTGENGPEMIIDSKAFKQMNPNLRESLIREIRGIKGFENGYYNAEALSVNRGESQEVFSSAEVLAVLVQLKNVLEKIDNEGLVATVSNKDLPSMKNLQRGIKDYQDFRNRNKIK